MAKIESETETLYTPTYYRRGLLQKEELAKSEKEAMAWLRGQKAIVIASRMIEISKTLDKNG